MRREIREIRGRRERGKGEKKKVLPVIISKIRVKRKRKNTRK